MRVFISSQAVDDENAQALISTLRAENIEVEHSPRNPAHGCDDRWQNWYSSGLSKAIAECDLFIIVVDKGWDSSTWMAIEADAWRHRWLGTMLHAFYWNPQTISVVSQGMAPYLKQELPKELSAAVKRISKQNNLL